MVFSLLNFNCLTILYLLINLIIIDANVQSNPFDPKHPFPDKCTVNMSIKKYSYLKDYFDNCSVILGEYWKISRLKVSGIDFF